MKSWATLEIQTKAMSKNDFHVPVLCFTAIEGLAIKTEGRYIDVTFGGGGHSLELLDKLGKNGRLMLMDQDSDAASNIPDDERVQFIAANFQFLQNFARHNGFIPADGILADLGVSSHQFNSGGKGFSTRFDGPLDMRMNTAIEKNASDVVNAYSEEDLTKTLSLYGEIKNSRKLAKNIIKYREKKAIQQTSELKEIAEKTALKPHKKNQYTAQVFQAIRIEVNDELSALKKMLEQSSEVIKKGGRLVVISYHSLEDRLVKNYLKHGNFEGQAQKDLYGKMMKPFDEINKKPMVPDEKEIAENPRARSAKMRIGVRNGE